MPDRPTTLVAVYSRDGSTRRVAEHVAARLRADLVAIVPAPDRYRGALGTLRAILHGLRGTPAPVAEIEANVEAYDLVIVATPIWAGHIAAPARGFLVAHKPAIRDYATLYTCAGRGQPEAGEDMARIMGPSPRAVLDLTARDLGGAREAERIETFARELGLA